MLRLPRRPFPCPIPSLFAWCTALAAQGDPTAFLEEFALAPDRAKTLSRLIPGTEEYYDFACRTHQQAGSFDEAAQVLAAWQARYGRTARFVVAENRQALLTYERNPEATLSHLRRRLELRFDHQREDGGAPPDLPSRLDPALISTEALTERAYRLHEGTIAGFTHAALPLVAASDLDDRRLSDLLQRVRHPDLPNLAALVVRNLRSPDSRGFGSVRAHGVLLRAQLDECARQIPELLAVRAFQEAYVRCLRPGEDTAWEHDREARLAYLERLQAFADRLPPAGNSLKAHVLYHRLRFDLAHDSVDRERVLAYLRLPRKAAYVSRAWAERQREPQADLEASFPTGLGRVGDDEELVRACLAVLLRDADNGDAFAELIDGNRLRRWFAEIKLLAGVGDAARWHALLDPSDYEELKERVEIGFAPTQPTRFRADEPVAVEVDVKNVPSLLVRVFEINALAYYREVGKEIDATIDLDGLVPNHESTHAFAENPLRRVRRRIELPALAAAGVYVVELIGNGTASRAVIHKGRLQYTERLTVAGHALRVRDETGVPVPDARAYFAGREFAPDADGEIVVPYSTDPDARPIVLAAGRLATLATLRHRAENYDLHAAMHVEREALLARRSAKLLVRAELLVGGERAGIGLLEEPVLALTATDLHGVTTRQEVRGFALRDDRETVHEFVVPDGLVRLAATLRAKVRRLSHDDEVVLSTAPAVFTLNGIEPTDLIACPLLGRTPDGYVLDVLGKEGEPKANRVVRLELWHRLFHDPVQVTLATDARGRIELGSLPDIVELRVSGFPDDVGTFRLAERERTYPRAVHALAGETVRVPYQGTATTASRAVVSFLEVRDNEFVRDVFDRVALAGGFVELRDLEPGDYDLWLREADVHVTVRVTAGRREGGWLLGGKRILQAGAPPLHVVGAELGDELRVRLANAGPRARVHVFATRYVPAFDPFQGLRGQGPREPARLALRSGSASYESGRDLGDELRYVLERRFARRFPGNMLRRPSLLLNPWALEEAPTGVVADGLSRAGSGTFGGRAGPAAPAPGAADTVLAAPGAFPNLDFLPEPASVVLDLRPDAAGEVRVPAAALGDRHFVQVVATDGKHTVKVSLVRAEQELKPRRRALPAALAADRHLVERRRIELIAAGGSATLADGAHARAQTYDSLAAVFDLLVALTPGSELQRFAFLPHWPELSVERKRELYSEHACHELHFFLHEKDPEFFAAEVRPFLASKLHPTFLDHWLLGTDLSGFLEPRAFARLNAFERILLARRLPAVADAVRRLSREQLELAPPDPDRARTLFETALLGRRLAGRDEIATVLDELEEGADLRTAGPAGVPAQKPAEPPAEAEGYVENQVRHDADKDVARRAERRRLFRGPDVTRRLAERNYWRVPIADHDAGLIPMSPFWLDFAVADPAAPFTSVHVAHASRSVHEALLALAVLDLPFRPGAHETAVDGAKVTLRAASPLLLVRKELVDAPRAEDALPVQVSQDFYRNDDRFRFVGGERRDAFVTGEFLTDTVYGCQVVVTNPTSARRRLEVLLQVPEGAIPVRGSTATRGVAVQLEPYATEALNYHFYFPRPGAAPHYPVHVTEADQLVAFAAPRTLQVVQVPSAVDTTSWVHVAAHGDDAAVLAFLDRENLLGLDLRKIAWRLRDRAFWSAVVARLRERLVYDDVVWSYSIHHGDVPAIREYLRHADRFVAQCGRWLQSPLLAIDPVERRAYEHVEFEPLVHARAHRFGPHRRIDNEAVARQYEALLSILADKPRLDDGDWLAVTYHLLLQDRVGDALATFAKVDPARLATRVQYDYLRAYLDFFTEEHAVARGIAAAYADHPIPHWRARFREILAHLDEAEGKVPPPGASPQDALAASEPALELAVQAGKVVVRYRNLTRCTLSFYPMDLELLFSRRPFADQNEGSFAYVRPLRSEEHALPEGASQAAFDLPADLARASVLVEASAGGVVRRQPYHATSMTVQVLESYGQVRVTDAGGKPVSRVYVKVFARDAHGGVRFHKDGYTDLRGRFDYASVSGDPGNAVRFALLVLDDERGAVIREVDPPRR